MRIVAVVLTCALAACGPSLATRYAVGNQALSTGDGAMYLIVISPLLQSALNDCIPAGTAGASPVLVMVADVAADGVASDIDIEPDGPGTHCVRSRLAGRPLPKPPLRAGQASFPVGLRIDTR